MLWLQENGALRPEVFAELFDLCNNRPIYLFVDQVALQVDRRAFGKREALAHQFPILIVDEQVGEVHVLRLNRAGRETQPKEQDPEHSAPHDENSV